MSEVTSEQASKKSILEEIAEWFHNWWYGQPEQTQHEGTSSADEAGSTTEVAEAGGADETTVDGPPGLGGSGDRPPPTGDSHDSMLPRYKGTEKI